MHFHLFADPEFWVAVSGLLFICVVFKPLRRSLVGGLDSRAERIRNELDEARRLRDEAEQLVAEYRKKERDAVAEAQAIVTHAQAEAERIAAQAARDLEQSLTRRQRLAEERIRQAEAKAVDEVRSVAVDVAVAAAHGVIAAEVDAQRGAALIDAAIAALPQRLR
jgi:F-type H+-transporting ATPase subunit b